MKSEVIVTEHELPAEVIHAIKKGSKIEAIKILREKKGLGLANAKVLVDRVASRIAPKPSYSGLSGHRNGSRTLIKSLLLLTLLAALYSILIGF